MNNTLNEFNARKSKTLGILEKLQKFLQQSEVVGVQIDSNLTAKLQTAIKSVAEEKLKIALIGGFSEGKTAIAAAWMEKLDKSSMKISHQESSDEVKVYDVGSDFVLVDTPGLFGFKEKYNDESHSIEKYKNITKKYVSEAHLVIYVMDSTNPVKESQKEDLVWLFRILNLLPRTVFVLSRFDEVADVEDDLEYNEKLTIKRNNVIGRLKDMINLSDKEIGELAIVAVAANPFDKGTEYWLSKLEKFKILSHINLLQNATYEKIKANGGTAAIVDEMKKSVILDVLNKQLPIAIANDEKIGQEVGKLEDMDVRLQKQLNSINSRISDARINLRQFVTDYFSDLILQVKGTHINTFFNFFEREVGNEGVVLAARLQNEFDRQLGSVTLEINAMESRFNEEINHFNNSIKVLGKQGIKYVLTNKLINNITVLATRDGITAATKMVGMDLSKLLKFKPWGAFHLAEGLNGVLSFLGLALEIWDSWDQAKREDAFHKSIAKIVKDFEQQRKELLDLLNGSQFIEKFFADYLDLQRNLKEVQQSVIQRREQQRKFNEWRKTGEAIDVEFTVL